MGQFVSRTVVVDCNHDVDCSLCSQPANPAWALKPASVCGRTKTGRTKPGEVHDWLRGSRPAMGLRGRGGVDGHVRTARASCRRGAATSAANPRWTRIAFHGASASGATTWPRGARACRRLRCQHRAKRWVHTSTALNGAVAQHNRAINSARREESSPREPSPRRRCCAFCLGRGPLVGLVGPPGIRGCLSWQSGEWRIATSDMVSGSNSALGPHRPELQARRDEGRGVAP